jgi:hypothetical protein
MVNPTIASTRSGGPIAAAYATVRHLGDEGYLRLASLTLDAVRGLADAVSNVDDLRLMAAESTVVAFTTESLDLFVLADELTARGWHTQPQLSYAGLPRSIHLTVTASVAPLVEQFGQDLAAAAAATRAAGPVTLPPDLVAMLGALQPSDVTPDFVGALAQNLGLGGESPLPARQAVINTLLDAASIPVRAALLKAFLSLLQRPTL